MSDAFGVAHGERGFVSASDHTNAHQLFCAGIKLSPGCLQGCVFPNGSAWVVSFPDMPADEGVALISLASLCGQ